MLGNGGWIVQQCVPQKLEKSKYIQENPINIETVTAMSELLMCGGGVRSILLLPLVARCLESIDVCIWRMFVFMSVVMTVWGSCGNVCCVASVVKIVFLALKYVVCLCKECDGCCVFCLYVTRGSVGARVWSYE